MARRDVFATVTLHELERIGNTVNGNPRYRLHTDEGTFLTQSDAGVVFGITNDKPVGKRVRLTMTPARRVWDMAVL